MKKLERIIAISGLAIAAIGFIGAITVNDEDPAFYLIMLICLAAIVFGFIISYIFDDTARAKSAIIAASVILLSHWYRKRIKRVAVSKKCYKFVRTHEDPYHDMYRKVYATYAAERDAFDEMYEDNK